MPDGDRNNLPNNGGNRPGGREGKGQQIIDEITLLNMPTAMDSSLNGVCLATFQNGKSFNSDQATYCCTFIYSSLMAELTVLTAGSSDVSNAGAATIVSGEISSTGYTNYMNPTVRPQILSAKETARSNKYIFDSNFQSAAHDMGLVNNLHNYASFVAGLVKAKEIKEALLNQWTQASAVSQLHKRYKDEIDASLDKIIRFAEKEKSAKEMKESSSTYSATQSPASLKQDKEKRTEIEKATESLHKLSNFCSSSNVANK